MTDLKHNIWGDSWDFTDNKESYSLLAWKQRWSSLKDQSCMHACMHDYVV